MPKASRDTAAHTETAPGYEGRFDQLGNYTVGFEAFETDMDAAPLFAGLPDDRCQSPHWGVVLEGRVTFRYADREESVEAGEAYYAPPGHTPVVAAGTRVVEFSPTGDYERTMAVVMRNVAQMAG